MPALDELEGDGALDGLGLLGLPDLTHAALAELVLDAVVGQGVWLRSDWDRIEAGYAAKVGSWLTSRRCPLVGDRVTQRCFAWPGPSSRDRPSQD